MSKKGDPFTWEDLLLTVFIPMTGGLGIFLAILVGGHLLLPDIWKSPAADIPAQSAYQEPIVAASARQDPAPTSGEGQSPERESAGQEIAEPMSDPIEPAPDPAIEPPASPEQTENINSAGQKVETPVSKPAEPVPNPATTSNTPVAKPQMGGASATLKSDQPDVNILPSSSPAEKLQTAENQSNGSGNPSSLDWPEGKFLASKSGNVYHRMYCEKGMTGAVNIKEENKIWYNSEEEAIADGKKRCGNCW